MSPDGGSTPSSLTHVPRIQPCTICQQRKVKCDRHLKEPCTNCSKAGVECVLAASSRRKKTPAHYSDLLIRVRRYEDALKAYGANIDKIARGESSARDCLVIRGRSPPESAQSSRERSPYLEKTNGTGLTDQFLDGEEILRSSSEMEPLKTPIMSTYDTMFDEYGDRQHVFVVGAPSEMSDTNLASLHPSPVQIFRLWQIFLDRINPLTKILHAPTVQQRVLEASGDLENMPKSLEALMFSIYYFAATALTNEESQNMFRKEQAELTREFKNGVHQALVNASFLKSSDIVTLQAFVLYLSASVLNIDPRSLYSLIGLAIRIAHRMGLDTSVTTPSLSPFQIEQRRRLWWSIAHLDIHIAELSGGGSPLLNQSWDTNLPLNINDSDLYPEMKEFPGESEGLTEMVFVLCRYEIASYLHNLKHPTGQNGSLEELEERIDNKYLRHLQTSLPFHRLTNLMARSTFSKIYITLHHNRHFPKASLGKTPSPTKEETITFFTHTLTQLDLYNSLLTLSDPSTNSEPEVFEQVVKWKREVKKSLYHWYTQKNYPFAAQILLLLFLRTPIFSALRGEKAVGLVEKAWDVLNKGFFLKRMGGSRLARDSPINIALAALTLSAWDARESELRKTSAGGSWEGEMEIPGVVRVMKCEKEERIRKREGKIESVDRVGTGLMAENGMEDVSGMFDSNMMSEGFDFGLDGGSYRELFGMDGVQSGIGDLSTGFWGNLVQEFEM
ncbi:uncharacterized protein PAC_04513 [Phialocephala subalpina]|uniref:Zn(2)-C6 fungal-type domain-containing protein n=1 Tax=Phialocephala subalpina TaxID=576137 RepID=A0A1L7WPC9_9HELO|nr:uncharacterized protein PAC_04513 [Phialocephala subalpina]